MEAVQQAEARCHICDHLQEQGVWLVHGYICAECLTEISSTEVDNPRYHFFIRKLRELWQT